MSVRVMGGVWDLDLPAPKKLVLLALADHADHDGLNARPSVRLIARKTGYSERQVQYVMRQLEEDGYLAVQEAGGGRGHPTHYRINLNGACGAPIGAGKGARHSVKTATKGANRDAERVQSSRARVDKVNRQERTVDVTPLTPQGGKRRMLTSWPEGFDLTDERRRVAAAEGIDADREWQRFRDWAEAKDQRYKDWDAAWRNWCRSPFQQKNGRPPGAATLARPTGGTKVSGEPDERTRAKSSRWLERHSQG